MRRLPKQTFCYQAQGQGEVVDDETIIVPTPNVVSSIGPKARLAAALLQMII
jgi:hypothetical protein